MRNDLAFVPPAPSSPQPTRCRRTGWAVSAVVAVTVALALTGCGARAAHRDATPTTSTTAPAAATSTSAAPPASVPIDDIERDLAAVQSDLDGAAQDLRDGPTEATTDTRG